MPDLRTHPADARLPNRITIRAKYSEASTGFYSFIGPVAYYSLRNRRFSCQYFCDGMLASALFSVIFRRKVRRTSFDYSSIARPFFEDCQQRARRVLVIGGTASDAASFSDHLKAKYPRLQCLCLDGYPAGGYTTNTLRFITATANQFEAILLALGSPLQEEVGQHLFDQGFRGTIITCGAFVAQTVAAGAGTYYPRFINALRLRFLWRLIHEPHTRSRFKYVFMFPVSYALDSIRGQVEFSCE